MAPLKRETISDKLADIIGRKIIRNELKSGESITETHLSKEYGISRSPVRDALHMLEQIRLVERGERGSYQVTVLTIELIENLYNAVNIMFQYAFSKAAEKATASDLQYMRQHVDNLKKSIVRKDFDLYLNNVTYLAETVLRMSGNPIVEEIAMKLMPNAERAQWASITYLPDQLQIAVGYLKEGYEMIAAGDSEGAAKAFEMFAYTHKALVIERLAENGMD
jgi:DNA-binding GntR family transcriptional regulator